MVLGLQCTWLPAPQPRSPQEGNTLQIKHPVVLRSDILLYRSLVSESNFVFTSISETVKCLLTITSLCVFFQGGKWGLKNSVSAHTSQKKSPFREQCRHVFLNYCSCSLVRTVWHSIQCFVIQGMSLITSLCKKKKKKPWNPNPFPQSSKRELDKQWAMAVKLGAGTMAATKKIKGLLTHSSYNQERFHTVLIIPQNPEDEG